MNQQINLYHPVFRRQEKVFSAVAMLQATGIVLLALLLLYGYAGWRVYALRAQVRQADADHRAALAQFERAAHELTVRAFDPRLAHEAAELEARYAVRDQIMRLTLPGASATHQGFSQHFVALARQHISGLWLTEVVVADAGVDVTLAGRTLRPELVPRYLQRLSAEARLAGLRFETFRVGRPEPQDDDGAKRPVAPYLEFAVRSLREASGAVARRP